MILNSFAKARNIFFVLNYGNRVSCAIYRHVNTERCHSWNFYDRISACQVKQHTFDFPKNDLYKSFSCRPPGSCHGKLLPCHLWYTIPISSCRPVHNWSIRHEDSSSAFHLYRFRRQQTFFFRREFHSLIKASYIIRFSFCDATFQILYYFPSDKFVFSYFHFPKIGVIF